MHGTLIAINARNSHILDRKLYILILECSTFSSSGSNRTSLISHKIDMNHYCSLEYKEPTLFPLLGNWRTIDFFTAGVRGKSDRALGKTYHCVSNFFGKNIAQITFSAAVWRRNSHSLNSFFTLQQITLRCRTCLNININEIVLQ